MSEEKTAVVLLSGGLDSTTTLAIAKQSGFAVNALTFDYGQLHRLEIDAARRIATQYAVARHVVVTIDLRVFGGSALTSDLAVPKGRTLEEMGQGIPVTYVPARNTIFLSYALAWAKCSRLRHFSRVNALDYSGYPDCRPESSRRSLPGQSGNQSRRRRAAPSHDSHTASADKS